MLERLESQNVWPLFEGDETYPHGMLHTARALSEEHHALNKEVVDALSSSLNSVYDDHRVTVVAFYSEVSGSCDNHCHAHTHNTYCIVGIFGEEINVCDLVNLCEDCQIKNNVISDHVIICSMIVKLKIASYTSVTCTSMPHSPNIPAIQYVHVYYSDLPLDL